MSPREKALELIEKYTRYMFKDDPYKKMNTLNDAP